MKALQYGLLALLLFAANLTMAQDPAECLNDPIITEPQVLRPNGDPGPLAPGESGTITFDISDNFNDIISADQGTSPLRMRVSFSNLEPTDGAASISGSLASSFSWLYDAGSRTFQGTMIADVPQAGGDIIIAFDQVNQFACGDGTDRMGFAINLQPAACMNGIGGNVTDNDSGASFTCVDASLLPVELLGFDAELIDGKDGLLTWSTATELDNDKFEIERSFNGFDFEYIAEVPGAGTSQTVRNYTYTDPSINVFNENEIYYRLRQVDYDGTSAYSDIELISIDGEAGLQIISVEFGGIYRLKESFGSGIERVDIYNSAGQLQSSENFGKSDVVDLDTRTLAQGVYMLVINENYKRKLIVTR